MKSSHSLILAITICGACLPAWGIVLNQVDTFTALGTAGWSGNAGPTNVSTGGPAGTGDRFLRIRRTAIGNPLGTFNLTQWAGNYLTAGVGAIQFDLNHLVGTTPVSVRIMLFGTGGTWASTLTTPVSSGWNTYTFDLGSTDMTHVVGNQGAGTGVLADTLANVTRVLIRHDPAVNPTPPGTQTPGLIATLGLDNIRAIAPPHQLGDTDGDNDVDTADLLAVKTNFGDAGPNSPGDADEDGDTDIHDFIAVKNNIGASFSGPGLDSPGLAFVPEPASMTLLALSGLVILRRGWRESVAA